MIKYLGPKSKKTLSEQIEDYFNNVLKATDPKSAPNYDKLPENETKSLPSKTNKTTKPIFTKDEKN